MSRPNELDWIVYRLFRWWWNPILGKNSQLARSIGELIVLWPMVQKLNDDLASHNPEPEE